MYIENAIIRLKIADIPIAISAEPGLIIKPSTRHEGFQDTSSWSTKDYDKTVKIKFCHSLPDPEISPVNIWEGSNSIPSWKVFDYNDESRIFIYDKTLNDPTIISVSHKFPEKPILITSTHSSIIEVLEYPLDIILLYCISKRYSILLVHASGFILDRCGHVCLGKSGIGKSTLCRLATESGGLAIQDDRLILRLINNEWIMYPLPLSQSDHPVRSKINRLNSLAQGRRNLSIPLTGMLRLNQFLPHMIHFPNWKRLYGNQIFLMQDLLKSVRFFQFSFVPNLTAIDYLKNGKDSCLSYYIPPEKPVPAAIKGFRKKHDPNSVSRR